MIASVAPMEGVTIFPTRLWLHYASEPATMTAPFLRVTAAFDAKELPFGYAPELGPLRGLLPYDLTPQLMAAEPDDFLRAADLLPPDVAPVIELNCGCPSPASAGRPFGSGILRDPCHFGMVLDRLSRALGPQRFAVKMRLGYDSPDELDALLAQVQGLPLARITVHGRTRADGYRGAARWDLIGVAAARAQVPTVASGDVIDLASYAAMRAAAPAAAGVMIGRGALRNPWVFAELRTGEAAQVELLTLLHVITCYAMLHELWLTAPEKLVARLAGGRLSEPCGTDPEAWERLAAKLTDLALGAPRVAGLGWVPDLPVSPTVMGRLRYLWAHLQGALPEAFQGPSAQRGARRAKGLGDLLEMVRAVGNS